MNFSVEAAIVAVHIVRKVGRDQHMVKRRVEHGALLRRSALDLNLSETPIPGATRRPPDCVETRFMRVLRLEIDTRGRCAHIGYADPHGDDWRLSRIEVQPSAGTFGLWWEI